MAPTRVGAIAIASAAEANAMHKINGFFIWFQLS